MFREILKYAAEFFRYTINHVQLLNFVAAKKMQNRKMFYADENYIRAFRDQFPVTTVRKIVKLNSGGLISDITFYPFIRTDKNKTNFETYLDKCSELIQYRIQNEYLRIDSKNTTFYPYSYLFKHFPLNNYSKFVWTENNIRIDFIYAIKDRREDILKSISSLQRSALLGKNRANSCMDIRIVIVEDISDNMIEISDIPKNSLHIDLYKLDTKIPWTRSGILNFGIRKSDADMLAFVDSDFVFPKKFFQEMEAVLRNCDVERDALAVNVFETETHEKAGVAYSKGSPYAFMRIVPRNACILVSGFDEGFVGHGYEDMEFVWRLERFAGIRFVNTMRVRDGCFVLHRSHHVRTGETSRDQNRERYEARKSVGELSLLLQDEWGEFECISHQSTPKW